ncbi:MAG: hypothetical protein LBB23_01650 [Rickettsiales bacterium]|jgi:hypothetical protein|nr:hypothetical protein [Rickettsiales bacterium]
MIRLVGFLLFAMVCTLPIFNAFAATSEEISHTKFFIKEAKANKCVNSKNEQNIYCCSKEEHVGNMIGGYKISTKDISKYLYPDGTMNGNGISKFFKCENGSWGGEDLNGLNKIINNAKDISTKIESMEEYKKSIGSSVGGGGNLSNKDIYEKYSDCRDSVKNITEKEYANAKHCCTDKVKQIGNLKKIGNENVYFYPAGSYSVGERTLICANSKWSESGTQQQGGNGAARQGANSEAVSEEDTKCKEAFDKVLKGIEQKVYKNNYDYTNRKGEKIDKNKFKLIQSEFKFDGQNVIPMIPTLIAITVAENEKYTKIMNNQDNKKYCDILTELVNFIKLNLSNNRIITNTTKESPPELTGCNKGFVLIDKKCEKCDEFKNNVKYETRNNYMTIKTLLEPINASDSAIKICKELKENKAENYLNVSDDQIVKDYAEEVIKSRDLFYHAIKNSCEFSEIVAKSQIAGLPRRYFCVPEISEKDCNNNNNLKKISEYADKIKKIACKESQFRKNLIASAYKHNPNNPKSNNNDWEFSAKKALESVIATLKRIEENEKKNEPEKLRCKRYFESFEKPASNDEIDLFCNEESIRKIAADNNIKDANKERQVNMALSMYQKTGKWIFFKNCSNILNDLIGGLENHCSKNYDAIGKSILKRDLCSEPEPKDECSSIFVERIKWQPNESSNFWNPKNINNFLNKCYNNIQDLKCINDVGKEDDITINDCDDGDNCNPIKSTLADLSAFQLDKASWMTKTDGGVNWKRLGFDALGGVAVGALGGFVTNAIVKNSQVDKGFDAVRCKVAGQETSGWGDSFSIGAKF